MKPFKTNLDIYGITKSTYWDIVQGDTNAYPCEFTILAKGKPYDMSTGVWTATITWVRANKTTVLTGAEKIQLDGNVLKYTLESNVYAVAGALVASVELYKDGSRLTTCQFTAKVREQLSDGTEIPAQDEYNILIDLLEQVTESADQASQAKEDAKTAVGELNTMKGTLQGWLDDPAQFEGLSAYEIWLAQGNAGTEAEFIASLKGDPGEVTQVEFDALEGEFDEHKNDYATEIGDVETLTTASKQVVGAINDINAGKADKQQEAWITPTLLNGWYAIRSWEIPQYMKDSLGFVHFRGVVAKGVGATSNISIILPSGYRPDSDSSNTVMAIAKSSAVAKTASVKPNGALDIAGAADGEWFTLHNIFKAV